jgi:hypothetical protein
MPAIAEIDGFGLRPEIATLLRSSFNEEPHAAECQGLRALSAAFQGTVFATRCLRFNSLSSSGLPDCSSVEFDAKGTRVPKSCTKTQNGSRHFHLSLG